MEPCIFPEQLDQRTYLSVLSRAPADAVKRFADALIPELGAMEVVRNRSGLVMLPMNEPVQGVDFYLGEVLIAEAHVRLANAEGYAACLGRDLQQALAIVLVDAAYTAGLAREQIAIFVAEQASLLEEADRRLLCQVEATRGEMETFQ